MDNINKQDFNGSFKDFCYKYKQSSDLFQRGIKILRHTSRINGLVYLYPRSRNKSDAQIYIMMIK